MPCFRNTDIVLPLYILTPGKLSCCCLFFVCLAVAGCGGGGGSSNNNNNSNPAGNDDSANFNTSVPETSLVLDRSNARSVALHISQLVLDLEDLASAISIGVIVNSAKDSGVRFDGFSYDNIQGRRLSVYGACETGSISVSGDIGMDFNDCEYSNSVYGGTVNLDIVTVGLPVAGGEYSFAGDGVADNFTILRGGKSVHIDGDFDVTNGTIADTEVSGGTSINIDGLVGDKPLYFNEDGETTRLAGGYDAGFTSDTATATPINYSQTINGRVASTILGGQVTVESSLFSGTDNNFPGSGELEVFGANGSKVELEVLNEDTVQISVDANGDDDFDDAEDGQETITWRAFLGI